MFFMRVMNLLSAGAFFGAVAAILSGNIIVGVFVAGGVINALIFMK